MVDVILSGGGINWCWYHWGQLDLEARTFTETRADRFHRVDERQGADSHPKAEAGFDVYHAPDDSADQIATWGADWIAQWQANWAHNLTQWKLPADTKSVVVIRSGAHEGAYVWVRK
jgi:hypothetical protein